MSDSTGHATYMPDEFEVFLSKLSESSGVASDAATTGTSTARSSVYCPPTHGSPAQSTMNNNSVVVDDDDKGVEVDMETRPMKGGAPGPKSGPVPAGSIPRERTHVILDTIDLTMEDYATLILPNSKKTVLLKGHSLPGLEGVLDHYSNAFSRTAMLLCDKTHDDMILMLNDIAGLATLQDQWDIITRHHDDWLPAIQDAEKVLQKEQDKKERYSQTLGRDLEKMAWSKDFVLPSQKRKNACSAYVKLIGELILDLNALKPQRTARC